MPNIKSINQGNDLTALFSQEEEENSNKTWQCPMVAFAIHSRTCRWVNGQPKVRVGQFSGLPGR